VKILSAEDLIWTELTNRLDELGAQFGCSFVALPIAHRGIATPDDEVARICQREGAAALLTANYKDFAAKVVYYQALLSAGVSAIVLRQPNPRMEDPDIDYQLALVEPHLQRIVTWATKDQRTTIVHHKQEWAAYYTAPGTDRPALGVVPFRDERARASPNSKRSS
jgi:hypothetical protein